MKTKQQALYSIQLIQNNKKQLITPTVLVAVKRNREQLKKYFSFFLAAWLFILLFHDTRNQSMNFTYLTHWWWEVGSLAAFVLCWRDNICDEWTWNWFNLADILMLLSTARGVLLSSNSAQHTHSLCFCETLSSYYYSLFLVELILLYLSLSRTVSSVEQLTKSVAVFRSRWNWFNGLQSPLTGALTSSWMRNEHFHDAFSSAFLSFAFACTLQS